MINWQRVKEGMMNDILPSLGKFIWKNKSNPNVTPDVIKGEFYTLIRRHLKELTLPHNGDSSISVHNIDNIIITDGIIVYIAFLKSYSGTYNEKLIENLNDSLEGIDYNFSKHIFESSINDIIDEIKYKH